MFETSLVVFELFQSKIQISRRYISIDEFKLCVILKKEEKERTVN